MKDNKQLLKAIDEFRRGYAEMWSLEWDTLMYYFEDACRDYALEHFYEMWFTDDEAVDLLDSPRGYQLYVDYLTMYLCD